MSGRPSGATLRKRIEERSEKLGFSHFGVTGPDARPDLPDKLMAALSAGWMAEMDWMRETATRRMAPSNLWSSVRSVIMLGMDYTPERDPLDDLADANAGNISVYARNRDYHEVIKGRLKEVAGLLASQSGADVKVFVDTAPLMEKPLAEAAGLGWQGKNTMLVSRQSGCWLFLGAILTEADLPRDVPHAEHCGTCTRCLDICPTGAFPEPFRLDARKCLAYYSNEHAGPIPVAFRKSMGNRIYGCDDCLAVCPWNRFAQASREMALRARPELDLPRLADLARLDDAGFRKLFAGSPVKRIGRDRFLRNVLIAVGNADDAETLAPLLACIRDSSSLVRGAAVWAAGERLDRDELKALFARYGSQERDESVLDEWRAIPHIH